MSLVDPDATFLLWAVVVALVGFGFWSEKNTRAGRIITGIIVSMMSAMLLSNLRVIPFASPVYDSIFESILPLAIPLMLFRADLLEAFRTGGATVVAFGIGAVGIVVGAFVATLLIPLGESSAIAAGLFTATYTGGSANFAAVAIAADFNDGTTLTSMVAADIVATNLQTMLLVALPSVVVIRRLFGFEDAVPAETPKPAAEVEVVHDRGADLAGAAFAIAIAMLLVFLGAQTARWLGAPPLGIVFTTVYALIVSNLMKPVVGIMSHDFDIGLFFIFLFLVALAAGANVTAMIESGLAFFMFAMLMLLVHTAFIVLVSRLFELDLRSVVIGSTACVGGVTSATAIASAKGWKDLIIPGIMAGTIGNSFGTLLGVWVWSAIG